MRYNVHLTYYPTSRTPHWQAAFPLGDEPSGLMGTPIGIGATWMKAAEDLAVQASLGRDGHALTVGKFYLMPNPRDPETLAEWLAQGLTVVKPD